MQRSADVRDGILRFYERFSAGEAGGFAEVISQAEGVSVIGSGPGEGHDDRDDWVSTYERMMRGEMAGTRLERGDPRAYEEGELGWGVDEPQFGFPTAAGCRPASPPSCARRTASGRSSTFTSR